MNPKNPKGVRTVTVIVTHEDQRRDFSRTYTNRQITASGARYADQMSADPLERDTREWSMTTYENLPDDVMDRAWSLPERKA